MTRQKKLSALGAEVVRADLDEPESLMKVLKGVWGVYSVQNTWEAGVEREETQGKRFAELAKKAGVEHFVYSSVGSADKRTGIPHFDNKFRIEEKVKALGFASYVILRPVFFMDNWISPWFKPALDAGKLSIALKPGTKLQMVAVETIGELGRIAFEKGTELNRRAIEIAGDELTMPETARILGKALGREITFVPTPIEEVRKQSADYAVMLEWFDRIGYTADIPGLAREFGIRPPTLEEWAGRMLKMAKAA